MKRLLFFLLSFLVFPFSLGARQAATQSDNSRVLDVEIVSFGLTCDDAVAGAKKVADSVGKHIVVSIDTTEASAPDPVTGKPKTYFMCIYVIRVRAEDLAKGDADGRSPKAFMDKP